MIILNVEGVLIRSKLLGKLFFVTIFITAIIFSNFTYAWDDEIVTDIGTFIIGKHYEDSYLVFTLDMPDELGEEDVFSLWLDFQADGLTDGVIAVDRYDWFYCAMEGDPYTPSWITIDVDETTLSIGVATLNQEGSPLGSVLSYSFGLIGVIQGCLVVYPDELSSEVDDPDYTPFNSEYFEEEELWPEFVVPETPFGSIIALISMLSALILYNKIGH
jgi:hypothetical protein